MRLAWITTSVLTIGALAMFGCSTAPDAPERAGTSTSNVQGGTTDATHKYAVGVCDGTAPGRCQGICSGALILPNLVATARHCVSQSPEMINCQDNPTFGADRNTLFVTTNTSMFGGGSSSSSGWYKAKKIFRPADNHVCGNDIALIELESSVPATEAKPITPGIQRVMWDSNYFVPQFTAIGYGRTAPANGQFAGEGTRRVLSLIDVRCIPGSPTIDCPPQINEGEFVGGDGICQGDSGSSAYDQASFDADDPISFGVLSRGGQSPDGTECQGSLYSRFDAHRDFVLDAAKEASQNWTLYPEPSWTAYVDPPPGAKKPDPPKKADIGETCKRSKDCESGKCVPSDDGTAVCVANCSKDESVCGDGEICYEGACIPQPEETPAGDDGVTTDTNGTLPASDAPPAPQTVTTTTAACSFSGASQGNASGATGWLVGLGLALAAVRRRRR